MFEFLKAKFRPSPVKEDAWLGRSKAEEPVRNAQFVSFLQQSGFRRRVLDRHAKTRRIKKCFALATVWAVILSFVWIAFESAQALELF